MEEPLLSFVHISDTHLAEDATFNLPGLTHSPQAGAEALLAALRALPLTPDFILHTGDVVDSPHPAAYDRAHALFNEFTAPVIALAGNHDDPSLLQRALLGREDAQLPYCFEFERAGVQFLALDSSHPPSHAGELGATQREWLSERCTAADARPLVVALHHNPLQAPPSPWWDRMALRDGEAFHAALLPARERLRGVFFGHIHQPLQYYRDGILYCAVGGSWGVLHYYPDAEDFQLDLESLPSFNLVHIGPRTTTIRRHSFQVPITHDE